MNEIKCIAVDDEPLALEVIKKFSAKTDQIKLLQVFNNPIEASTFLQNEHVDLIFLDIQMPDLNGMELLNSLTHPPMVIFTSAHEEYAIQSYEWDAVDYLLKPFLFERFLKAIHKAQKVVNTMAEKPKEEERAILNNPEYLFVKSDTRFFKVNFNDIKYIEGMRDYIAIHTRQQRILTLMSMTNILKRLPEEYFKRIHKSYIVGIRHISLVQNNKVKIGDIEVPVSNTYREDFLKFIEGKQV